MRETFSAYVDLNWASLNCMYSRFKAACVYFSDPLPGFGDFGRPSIAPLNAGLSALKLKLYEFTISNAL